MHRSAMVECSAIWNKALMSLLAAEKIAKNWGGGMEIIPTVSCWNSKCIDVQKTVLWMPQSSKVTASWNYLPQVLLRYWRHWLLLFTSSWPLSRIAEMRFCQCLKKKISSSLKAALFLFSVWCHLHSHQCDWFSVLRFRLRRLSENDKNNVH